MGSSGRTAPFGWQCDPAQERRPRERRRVVRHEARGAILLEMKERYMAGWPTTAIARDLNRRGILSPSGAPRWGTDMVLKALRNPLHAGLIGLNKELCPGQHAEHRYWSPEERDLILERIGERAHRLVKERGVDEFLLSGVVFCAHCGRRLVAGRNAGGGARSYRCTSPRTNGQHRTRRNGEYGEIRACPGVSRAADQLEAAVVDVVADLARAIAVQTAAQQKLEEALDLADSRISQGLAGVQAELRAVEGGFSRLFEMLNKGPSPRTSSERRTSADGTRRRRSAPGWVSSGSAYNSAALGRINWRTQSPSSVTSISYGRPCPRRSGDSFCFRSTRT